jgi:hypothetical protein
VTSIDLNAPAPDHGETGINLVADGPAAFKRQASTYPVAEVLLSLILLTCHEEGHVKEEIEEW